MSTALTLYQTNTIASTISTAATLLENVTTGASTTNKNSTVGSGVTGWGQVYGLGTTNAWAAGGSIGSPDGNGYIDDATTLVGFHFDTGTWTATVRLNVGAGTAVVDIHVRAYQRSSGGTYTLIADMSLTGQTLTTTATNFSPSASGVAASNTFVTGDKLYADVWCNITTNSMGGASTIKINAPATGSATGSVNAQIVSPGYLSSTATNKDITIRAKLMQQVWKDATIRGRLSQQVWKFVTIRGNIGTATKKDITLRAKLSQQSFKDITLRGRLSQQPFKFVTIRGRTGTTNRRDITIRAKIAGPRLLSGGFTLFANGTGTASFDHYRCTEYPDPSLSLAPILPRVGTTLASWNANLPTNTTLGVDLSFDGVNWTDVSAQNGGNFPGIFSQPDPTTDGFSTNTSASYTSTNMAGGAAGTWTFNTANSRLVATGGTNAIFVYNAISRADVDFFADLDQSDAGGLVWQYLDQNNFYYLLIADTLASTGTKNTMTLYRVLSGTQTQLGQATISYTLGSGTNSATVTFVRGTYHRFRVSMLNGVITCFVDGVSLITFTDLGLGAGNMGLFNNGGSVGSRYYQLWLQPVGDYVSGTPAGDIVTGDFVYTRARLLTTDATVVPQLLDLTTMAATPSIGVGATIPAITYTATSIAKNFDDLAKKSNYSWFVDQNKAMNFRSRGAIAAPWILQSSPAGLLSSVDLMVDSTLELDVSNDLYRNRQTVLGAMDTGSFVESFAGDGSQRTFALGYLLAAVPTVTLNSQPQTVGVKGTTGSNWYYNLGDTNLVQDSAGKVLTGSDVLAVSYTGLFPVTIQVDDLTKQAALAATEGGTGIVEAVEDVTGQGLNKAAGINLANQLITRYGISGRTLIFTTRRNGLAIGQLLSIFLPEHGVTDGQFFITQVEVFLMKNTADTQTWQYKVTASELPRQASWAKLLATGLGLS